MNVNELVAIDVHTHAEEPCGTHPDDGYDDLQAAMAVYFNQPNNRPTIEETARYCRERKIGAVIFREAKRQIVGQRCVAQRCAYIQQGNVGRARQGRGIYCRATAFVVTLWGFRS